jgi:hypothetical protein
MKRKGETNMPQGPNDSPLKITPEMEKALAEAIHPSDITRILHDGLKDQGLVDADPFDPSVLHVREGAAPPAASAATRYGAKITINGRVHIAEGATQEEADAKIAEIIRTATHPTTRDDQGRFTADQGKADEAAAAAIVAKADLELKFKRGEIDTATYLAESGAVSEFFAKKGISLSDVEAAAQTAAGERISQSWAEATTEFLNGAGSDWPGGEENKRQMSKILKEMGAEDYPNVENLRRAWVHMKDNNMVTANPELERDQALLAARTPEEIYDALHGVKPKKAGSDSTWQSRTWNGHG